MSSFADVLARLSNGEITLAEANELLFAIPPAPEYTCATCQHLHGFTCERPGQPAQPMHPQSVRCQAYQFADPKLTTPPNTARRTNFMFK